MSSTARGLLLRFNAKHANDITITSRVNDTLSLLKCGRLDLAAKKLTELEQHMKIRRAAVTADER